MIYSIWFTQAQFGFRIGHAQAGENPELRCLFYKLASFLKVPVTPLFVFDGPSRPGSKRGKRVIAKPHWLTKPFQELLEAFGFPYYTVSIHRSVVLYISSKSLDGQQAPGEAEAELACLNRAKIIDAVITDDSDALLFGAAHVIRK
jgi:XPG I-region